MSTLRERIVQAVVDALNTGTPEGVPAAQRARTLALDLDQLDAILVYPLRDEARNVGGKRGPIVARSLELAVECWARETETASADAAVDPYVAWAIKALTDNTLGGLVNGLREEETNFAVERAQTGFCLAAITMVVEYQCKAGDLEQRT